MSGRDVHTGGLRREWLAAKIFAVVVVLLLIAFGVMMAISPPGTGPSVSPDSAARRSAAAVALCSAALRTAAGFGLVPAYTQLASGLVQEGAVRGRYTCFARTEAAKYQITFDLMCKDLTDSKCLNLFSVIQDGTGPLYQRH